MLIVSADGTKGANSLPLSFVGASATVSDVKVGQGGDILLFPTNFIIENGNLYLTNLTTTNKDGGEVKAAVSNKITLTFSLSGENLSRYTDTADIFVGKYSNIYTNTFDTFTNLTTIVGDSLKDANNFRQGEFNFGIVDKTFFKDNTFAITNNKSWRSGQ
ncbi:unknown [Brachyspira sp. CAG:700]|nr:unknown [Brachyspira sp. CAG:700]